MAEPHPRRQEMTPATRHPVFPRMQRLRRRLALFAAALLVALGTAAGHEGARHAHAQGSQEGLPEIVALGDSLTAGYGLPREQAWPALLQERLDEQGYGYTVINAGVSGDTSAGGLSRVDWLLRVEPAIVVVALGGNDGLRGLPPDQLERNLARIIGKVHGAGARVVLCGMRMPPNYGEDYTRRFRAVYADLADRFDVAYVPFLLEGVAMRPEMNQADGIHPTPAGQRLIMHNVWEALEPLLKRQGNGAMAGNSGNAQ